MANTLTGLTPDLYESLDIVSREMVGLIPSVSMDANAARAAVGQQVKVHQTRAAAAEDITPGQLPPDTGDQTVDNVYMTISKARAVPFRWTGEEQKGVNFGPGYKSIRLDQITQAMRTLTNEVEADLAALYKYFSRATGTAGTTPFASGLGDSAQIIKILMDNGCPMNDCSLVVDTSAGANLRTNTQLTKANEAGTDVMARQGTLLNVHGLSLRESAQIKAHTKGTGSGYLVNNASGLAIGDTTVAVDTGSGTIVAGDVLTFAGNSEKFVTASDLASGSLTIGKPGIHGAAIADNAALTVGNGYRANMAFHRSAIQLATRAPALPEEGDSADDRMLITDPRSGLTFEVAMYKLYRRVRYEISLAWGVKLVKPEFTALLLG